MEGDAGTGQLNPTEADAAPDDAHAKPDESLAPIEDIDTEDTGDDSGDRRASRLGTGWAIAICATLLILAIAAGAGGYVAFRSHQQSRTVEAKEAAALQAAKDCVSATQAPDTAAMTVAQSKIIECSTGDFGAQASLYSGMLLEAYQAANVTVAVSDMRAAVEKRNDDGSFTILVAVRVKVTNSQSADQDQGYRLRVQMAPDDQGAYKVAKLEQVTS
jgi:Mce-associated membrane protein